MRHGCAFEDDIVSVQHIAVSDHVQFYHASLTGFAHVCELSRFNFTNEPDGDRIVMDTENIFFFTMTPVDVRGNVVYKVHMILVIAMMEHASEMAGIAAMLRDIYDGADYTHLRNLDPNFSLHGL